jgi:hypothetical protein
MTGQPFRGRRKIAQPWSSCSSVPTTRPIALSGNLATLLSRSGAHEGIGKRDVDYRDAIPVSNETRSAAARLRSPASAPSFDLLRSGWIGVPSPSIVVGAKSGEMAKDEFWS